MLGRSGLSSKAAAANLGVTPKTLRRAAKRSGVVYTGGAREARLTERQLAGRLAFAKRYKRGYGAISWKDAFFTDSKIFHMSPLHGGQSVKYWERKGHHTKERFKAHAHQVHAYGGVCRYGHSRLLMVTGTSGQVSTYKRQRATNRGGKGQVQSGVCGQEYVNDVLPHLYHDAHAIFDRHGISSWVYVHDLASVHKGGTAWLKQKGQAVVEDWPSKGMDLNVIENVWACMDRSLALQHDATWTLEQFEHKVQEVWGQVCRVGYLRKCVDSVPSRLREVEQAGGGMTGH
jgi:hypothetical protein